MNKGVYERAVEDILSAERHLRSLAEKDIRSYRDLLVEVAYIFAGDKFEEVRKRDPNAPDRWKAEDWGRFFRGMRYEVGGWASPGILQQRLAAYERQVELDRKKIMELKEELEGISVKKEKQAKKKGEEPNKDRSQAALWPPIPDDSPPGFDHIFRSDVQWKRMALMIYLIGVRGWVIRREIENYIGRAANVSEEGGGSKGMAIKMMERGLVEQTLYSLNLGNNINFGTFQLLPAGIRVCNYLGYEPVETELEFLFRKHNGKSQEAHTLAMLCFAFHARLRGWDVTLIPEVKNTKARPDALVKTDDEEYYVEVELGDNKEKKWKNLVELQGFVVICASTQKKRDSLIKECKDYSDRGIATDLSTLIAAQKNNAPGPLFLQSW